MPSVCESSPHWYASWVRSRCRIEAREWTWRSSPSQRSPYRRPVEVNADRRAEGLADDHALLAING
jgi:hypothetical protein